MRTCGSQQGSRKHADSGSSHTYLQQDLLITMMHSMRSCCPLTAACVAGAHLVGLHVDQQAGSSAKLQPFQRHAMATQKL
jgi:hypothetical protein